MKKVVLFSNCIICFMAALSLVLFSAGSCDSEDIESESGYKDKWANLVNESKKDCNVNGNTITYGNHSYTVEGDIDYESDDYNTATAWVKFTNIPSGYTEFKAIYEGLLGQSVAGTAAMVPMAEEIYARNAATGEKCFNLLCNSEATVKGIIRILKTKIVPSEYAPENDTYIQRYLPAALLQGASYTNAYTPEEPYTVAMCSHRNKPQEVSFSGDGMVYYIYILTSGGWDSYQRGMEIYQNWDGGLFKVWNCSNAYLQCRTIRGTWGGLK